MKNDAPAQMTIRFTSMKKITRFYEKEGGKQNESKR